jgi:hypothetical protein
MRPVATTASLAVASPSSRLTTTYHCSIPPMPLVGEIARLDRAIRF